jgi:hypothetical protein
MTWDLPKAGEVGLYALSDLQEPVASLRLDCSDVESAIEQGTQFFERHAPELANGREKLSAAQSEAESSGRSVWAITGGTRCGPCFRLARWIDEHRETLEKDLVIVKVTAGLDEHANDIKDEIGGADYGIPFHVMLSPTGKVMITSAGPLGNIGMPSSVEGIRHFRSMLEEAKQAMTTNEIDSLIESFSE